MSAAVNFCIPGLEWKHIGQTVAVAATAGALRLGTRLLPVALTGSHPIEAVLATGLASLILFPSLDNRPLSKANMQRMWENVPGSAWISAKCTDITQKLQGTAVESSAKAPLLSDDTRKYLKRGLEGAAYLTLAAGVGSMGVALLRSKSWVTVMGEKGLSIAAFQLVALGMLHMNTSLQGNKLGQN